MAIFSTSSRVFLNWSWIWMSELEIKVWMRGFSAPCIAFHAVSISFWFARARPATCTPFTRSAIACTASKSPSDAIGKPASITSTPSFISWSANIIFSLMFMVKPGDCSPSRSVVSKIIIFSFSFIVIPLFLKYHRGRNPLPLIRQATGGEQCPRPLPDDNR